MYKKLKKSIGNKFAVVIFASVFVQNIALFYFETSVVRSSHTEEKNLDLQVQMATMQEVIGLLVKNDQKSEMQQVVASLATDPRINMAFVIDPLNKVLASSRMDMLGKELSGFIDKDIYLNIMDQLTVIKDSYKIRMLEIENKSSLVAVAPLNFGGVHDVVSKPAEVGLLVVWLDTKWIDHALYHMTSLEIMPAIIMTIIVAIVFVLIFYFMFTRRLNKIYDGIHGFRIGERYNDVSIKGDDEISELATLFNYLAKQANAQHDELKVINDKLKRTQDVAQIGTWELDVENNKLYWSDEVYILFGFKPQQFKATYELFLEGVHPEDRDKVNKAYTSSLRLGRKAYEIEHRIVRNDNGSVRYVHERCEHVRNQKGEVVISRGVVQDITSRKQAEMALQQSEVHFRSIINASPVPFALNDSNGNVLYLNPAFVDTFGYELLDIPTLQEWWHKAYPSEIYRENIKKIWFDRLRRLEETGSRFESIEANIRCKNGEVKTVLCDAAPLSESFKGVHLVIMYDISDRKEAQLKITDSEQRLRLATEASEIGIWQWNIKSNRIHWDAQMFRIYGIMPTPDGYVDYADWSLSVLPDELPLQESILDNTVRTVGRSKREFHIRRRNDNELRSIDAYEVARKDEHGNVEWVIGTNLDVTERKKYEQRLKKQKEEQQYILNSMTDAVVTINEEGTVLSYNTAAEVMFGFFAEEVIGRNVNILMPEEVAKHHNDYLRAYINGGSANVIGFGREVVAKRKTGELFPARLSVADLPSGQHEMKRFVGTCHDMTQEKMQQDIIKRTQKMDALGKLTGGVAHDFNNMLGVILGYTELLQTSLADDPQKSKYVHEIYHAGERAKKLTSKLLSFSRKKAGDVEEVDLNSLLRDELIMLQRTMTSRIVIELKLFNGLWPVYIDKAALEDAILNISINAMHAMPDGGNYTILTENLTLNQNEAGLLQLPPGSYVLLSMIDTGIGMDEDTMQRIFDPFFTTKGDLGTGLGMSQVYGFVQQIQGSITVDSSPGRGTRISIYIPRSLDFKTKKIEEPINIKTKVKKSKTILVVDDEPSLASMASEILESYGYKTYFTTSGQDALEILRNNPVDLVLSDIIMPGMDGYQLAGRILKEFPQVKIQLTSGYTDQRDPGVYAELHNNRLHKPYSSEALLQAINALLNV